MDRSQRTLVVVALALLLSLPATAELTSYHDGDPADADPPLFGPAFDLGGGGRDVDEAMQWVIDQVRGCTDCGTNLDLVVLRSSGSDGYHVWLDLLDGVDSIETFVFTDRASSYDASVARSIRDAEVVFFAGGDQCNYVRFFKDTPVQASVESVVARGGGVGGTSAGLAIMGEVIYDACGTGSSRSADALGDPLHSDIHLTDDFFRWQHLHRTITDTHFSERDRLGRLLVFMARDLQTRAPGSRILGIGIDERTSLVIDRNGLARVMGDGPVYFLSGTGPAETFAPATPLTWCEIELWVIRTGETFDLRDRPDRSPETMSVIDGELVRKPY